MAGIFKARITLFLKSRPTTLDFDNRVIITLSFLPLLSMLYDLSKPPYDQTTFDGRFRHFLRLTNPLNVLKTGSDLDQARETLRIYKYG